MTKHPFAGFLVGAVSLVSNLSYTKTDALEEFWLDEKRGWPLLGLVLAHSKLDVDNPTLREWCLLFIRHVTSWSNPIREKLQSLTMIDDKNPGDLESMKAFDALGAPLQDMYTKEMAKFKKGEKDQQDLHEAMLKAANVDVVDF